MGGDATTSRALGAVVQLVILIAAVVLQLYVLAALAAAAFLWQGGALVYSLLSGDAVPPLSVLLSSRLRVLAASDGAWTVTVGMGVVIAIAGWLVGVTNGDRLGRDIGFGITIAVAWALGMLRRARQTEDPEDPPTA